MYFDWDVIKYLENIILFNLIAHPIFLLSLFVKFIYSIYLSRNTNTFLQIQQML